ncbi:hypothetical protein Mia14_0451 [Candidatus Mancarchaeum acidiphilum]|uniref:Uncharacterized protein n=1 Tax=Candidatus Mancarchaeum acidiphilum TaxID=1920749 RepID=A0A218NMR0_9ARCH|nr:hypothetical protein [Candidatus Mancarchaeum acidiphilum]ASI13768.1 hypothetical protein Mia14_0451 [Candidatus Mancarchaeum acidiphilum]
MEDCIPNRYSELYKSLNNEINNIIEYSLKTQDQELDCINKEIQNAENMEDLNLVFDNLKLFRLKLIKDVERKLRQEKAKEIDYEMHYEMFSYRKISALLLSLIETNVDKAIESLFKIDTNVIGSVEKIAKKLGAKGFSITLGLPLNLTVTLNY